jgi:hypothetical protein
MPSTLEMCTRLLLECAGLTLNGPVISSTTKVSPNDLSIDITHTVSCAKSSVTVRTTPDNLPPSANKPTSPSPSSFSFSQNTFELSLDILSITDGLMIPFVEWDKLLRLLDANGGSLEGVMILKRSDKPWHITLKAHSPT